MIHYICKGGCRGVSAKPGSCQDINCPQHGMPLVECDCADNRHYGSLDNTRAAQEKKDKKKQEP